MPSTPPDPRTVLADPDSARATLRLAAVDLACSERDTDHEPLRAALADPAWLDRLDPPPTLHGSASTTSLARVIGALRENPAPPARLTLTRLASSPGYLREWRRTDLLVEASEVLRPPAPEIVALWSRELTPESVHAIKVVRACLRNGAPAGLSLVARAWGDARFDAPTKRLWARQYVLENRAREPVLAMVRDILRAGPPPAAARDLCGAVFDYQPLAWYGPHCTVDAPAWATSTPTARAIVRDLAPLARALDDGRDEEPHASAPALDAAVTRTLAELDSLDRAGS